VTAAHPGTVAVRTLDRIADLALAEALFAATWPGQRPATAALLKAVEHAGGYVAGAFLPGGAELVGAAAGFLAAHPAPALHSHLAAVVPAARGHGVGYALKTHQRAWAAERGLAAVTWTFDPLVRRNAWFNLGKLGAGVTEYLVDFYGRMDDGVNDGDASDRLLAVWSVFPDPAGPRLAGPAAVALAEEGGRPVPQDVDPAAPLVAVSTPPDVEALRRRDPALAHRWRIAVREALAPRLATGRVVGFTRAGQYLVCPPA
jgi:predicted GNAT superfamily acetyltransferase